MFILLPFVAVLFGADPAVIAKLILAMVIWLGAGIVLGTLLWELAWAFSGGRDE